jgi:hypothetical protein
MRKLNQLSEACNLNGTGEVRGVLSLDQAKRCISKLMLQKRRQVCESVLEG